MCLLKALMSYTRNSVCYEFDLSIVRTLKGQHLFWSRHIRSHPVTVDMSVSQKLLSARLATAVHVGNVDVASSIQGLGCCPVWMSVRPAMLSILYCSRSSSIKNNSLGHLAASKEPLSSINRTLQPHRGTTLESTLLQHPRQSQCSVLHHPTATPETNECLHLLLS